MFTPKKVTIDNTLSISSNSPEKPNSKIDSDDPNFLNSIEHKKASVKKPTESRIQKFQKHPTNKLTKEALSFSLLKGNLRSAKTDGFKIVSQPPY